LKLRGGVSEPASPVAGEGMSAISSSVALVTSYENMWGEGAVR
jgi:hypothetical protein